MLIVSKSQIQMKSSFWAARSEFNQIYKNFLFVSDYYQKIYGERYIDLFTASTFSKVVPSLIATNDYVNELKSDMYYQEYPSPSGDDQLINSFIDFIKRVYQLDFSSYEIMVCQGTMQAIDAISRVLNGKIVFVMDSTVTFAKSIPTANGAKIVLIKTNNGIIDFDDLEKKIKAYSPQEYMYLYLNYPNNPTGAQLSKSEFSKLIDITQKYNLQIVHDHDICFTSYDPERPAISIFADKRAIENSIEIYTLSKEFGLSGLRVGIIVGNKKFIRMIKYHNYEMNIMIPSLNQRLAALALQRADPKIISNKIQSTMKVLVEGFQSLGWTHLKMPQAGIAFLLPVPNSYVKEYGDKSGAIFSFYLQKNYGIGVGPAKCNCLTKGQYIRVLAMEPSEKCQKMFDFIKNKVNVDMEIDHRLYSDYCNIIQLAEEHDVR